jgi:molecular chaperone GrpE
MSNDNNRIEPTLDPLPVHEGIPGDASPEEREAAQAANEAGLLSQLQAEMAALKARNTELTEQFLRAQADIQNTRRRAEEEMSKARKFAVESFAESLLAVADSLEAGLAIKEATPQQIREGAEATLNQLKSVLERNKVIEIDPQPGDKFDPHQHQAISVVPLPPGSTQEPNTVVNVLQKGYLIAERILRPALVTVAAPK